MGRISERFPQTPEIELNDLTFVLGVQNGPSRQQHTWVESMCRARTTATTLWEATLDAQRPASLVTLSAELHHALGGKLSTGGVGPKTTTPDHEE